MALRSPLLCPSLNMCLYPGLINTKLIIYLNFFDVDVNSSDGIDAILNPNAILHTTRTFVITLSDWLVSLSTVLFLCRAWFHQRKESRKMDFFSSENKYTSVFLKNHLPIRTAF